MTSLWSYRFSVARGWSWVRERGCRAGDASQWLEVFQQDEPGVTFAVSEKEPKQKPKV